MYFVPNTSSGGAVITATGTAIALYFQNFTSAMADSMSVGEVKTLVDIRDDASYKVAKLSDGTVWMIQNLQIGRKASSYSLTTADSDTSGNFTLNNKIADVSNWPVDSSNGRIYNYSAFHCSDTIATCYYNWYTATAGSGNSSTTNGASVKYSICPKGWTLPTYNQIQSLYTNYGSSSKLVVSPTTLTDNVNSDVPGLYYTGDIRNKQLSNYNTVASFWTSTLYTNYAPYNIWVKGANSYAALSADPMYYGFSVRCVKK